MRSTGRRAGPRGLTFTDLDGAGGAAAPRGPTADASPSSPPSAACLASPRCRRTHPTRRPWTQCVLVPVRHRGVSVCSEVQSSIRLGGNPLHTRVIYYNAVSAASAPRTLMYKKYTLSPMRLGNTVTPRWYFTVWVRKSSIKKEKRGDPHNFDACCVPQ